MIVQGLTGSVVVVLIIVQGSTSELADVSSQRSTSEVFILPQASPSIDALTADNRLAEPKPWPEKIAEENTFAVAIVDACAVAPKKTRLVAVPVIALSACAVVSLARRAAATLVAAALADAVEKLTVKRSAIALLLTAVDAVALAGLTRWDTALLRMSDIIGSATRIWV